MHSQPLRFSVCCLALTLCAAGLAGEPAKKPRSAEEARADLLRVLALASRVLDTPGESYQVRRDAVMAANRVHEALADWGTKGQLAWYMERLGRDNHDMVEEELLAGALAAARGSQLHLAGIRAFWKQWDAAQEDPDESMQWRAKKLREALQRYMNELPKRAKPINVRPIKIKGPDLNWLKRVKAYKTPGKKKKKK